MKKCKGLTLVEAIIAAVILFVIALGALSYVYHSVKQKKMAWANMTATRTAQMVIEDWRSTGGEDPGDTTGYTPWDFDNDFIFQSGTTWKIEVEDLPMFVTLTSRVEATDATAGITLKELTVKVQWRLDFGSGQVNSNSPSMLLETFVRADVGGG